MGKHFFKNNKKFKIITGFKKNLRRITINENKINEKILDFTNNTEPLIQRFITDYLKHLKKKQKYFLSMVLIRQEIVLYMKFHLLLI